MQSKMEWFWVLLFGSFVPLSDQPTNLAAGVHDVALKSPLSAITSGAALYVDVTSMVPKEAMTIDGSRGWVDRSVEPGCLKATLGTDGATTVPLEFSGGFSFAPDSLLLILSGPGSAVPVRQNFNKLTVTSCIPLRQVRFFWANYRK